jgi:hypothetical protein
VRDVVQDLIAEALPHDLCGDLPWTESRHTRGTAVVLRANSRCLSLILIFLSFS